MSIELGMERQEVGLVHGAAQLFIWERVRKSPAIFGGAGGAPPAPFWVLFVRTKSTRGARGRVAPEAIE